MNGWVVSYREAQSSGGEDENQLATYIGKTGGFAKVTETRATTRQIDAGQVT
jgi:hypothetical protein